MELNIDEVIEDADQNFPNKNTRVMVSLSELKVMRERARSLNYFTPEEIRAAHERYRAPQH